MTRAGRLAVLVSAIALLGCASTRAGTAWNAVTATVEVVGRDTYASFQPVFATRLRLDNTRPAKASLQVFGVEGPVKEFDLLPDDHGCVLALKKRTGVAELVFLDTDARKLRVLSPATEKPLLGAKPDPKTTQEVGEMEVTYYWVESEQKYLKDPADTPLLNAAGGELGRFAKKFVERLKVEGTGKLRDGRVINIADKDGRFEVVRCPNGHGVQEYHLIPFRSIAVDREKVPIGTELFIPAAVGAKLPDGTVHDGHFWAHDVGGGIQGDHIDIFTGVGDQSEFLEKTGVMNLKKTKVYKVVR